MFASIHSHGFPHLQVDASYEVTVGSKLITDSGG